MAMLLKYIFPILTTLLDLLIIGACIIGIKSNRQWSKMLREETAKLKAQTAKMVEENELLKVYQQYLYQSYEECIRTLIERYYPEAEFEIVFHKDKTISITGLSKGQREFILGEFEKIKSR